MFQRSSLLLILSRNSLALLSAGLLIPLLLPVPWFGVELWRVWWVRGVLLAYFTILLLLEIKPVIGGERARSWSRFLALAKDNWLLGCIGLWFGWNLAVSLLGGSWQRALFGNLHRADGLLSLGAIVAGSLLITARWKSRGARHLATLATQYSLLVSVLLLLLILTSTVISAGFQGALPLYQYVRNSIGNINLMAGALVTAMPWLLVRLWRFRPWVALAVWCGITLQLSIVGSLAGSVVSGLVGGAVLAILSTRKSSIYIVSVGAVIFAILSYQQITAQLALQYTSTEGRVQIYRTLSTASLERPLFGWGWAGVSQAYRAQFGAQQEIAVLDLDKAHSSWLEQLIAAGFPGLVLLWIVQGGVIMGAVRSYLISQSGTQGGLWLALCASIISYLIFSQTNVTSVHQEIFFWLMAGIVVWNRHLVKDLLQ